MASKGVSTAGSVLGWAALAEEVPETFKKVPEVKEVPELNPEPSTLETTPLDEKEYKTYTTGLKDLGGALPFTCNLTKELKTEWQAAVTAANGGSLWWIIKHPTMGAVAFKGEPASLGMPAMSVDSVLEVSVYIVPTSAPQWVTTDVTVTASETDATV